MTPQLLDWITAIGSIATPIILALFTGIGWTLQRRIEKKQKEEEELRLKAQRLETELRDDRLAVYMEILEPFVILLTKDESVKSAREFEGKDKAQVVREKLLSISYRQAAFKLSLFGTDNVVQAYNDLMQFFYNEQNQTSDERGLQMLQYFGDFLLAIRKSVGNEFTTLDNFAMLEWLINDIRRIRAKDSKRDQT